mmetsp:Transcript_14318/g.35668  ORF Transcript_14318/g.35668 Transcript_14318/m.35668 type:complete len:160 (-) Transcript_14318:3-482(-)
MFVKNSSFSVDSPSAAMRATIMWPVSVQAYAARGANDNVLAKSRSSPVREAVPLVLLVLRGRGSLFLNVIDDDAVELELDVKDSDRSCWSSTTTPDTRCDGRDFMNMLILARLFPFHSEFLWHKTGATAFYVFIQVVDYVHDAHDDRGRAFRRKTQPRA